MTLAMAAARILASTSLVLVLMFADHEHPVAQQPAAGTESESPEESPADKDRNGSRRERKKKEPISVRGCLHGSTLGDVMAEEDIDGLTRSVTLKASREIRKALKEYDRHEVEITGVLTPAPRSPLSGRWGGTTVSVGGADPRRPIGQQTPPPVASIEVVSVRSVAASCQ